jgi:hypothetical protein
MMSQDSLEAIRNQSSLISEWSEVKAQQEFETYGERNPSFSSEDALYDPHVQLFEHPEPRAGFTPGSIACNGAWNNHVAPPSLELSGKTEKQLLRPRTAKSSLKSSFGRHGGFSSRYSSDRRKTISISLQSAKEVSFATSSAMSVKTCSSAPDGASVETDPSTGMVKRALVCTSHILCER